MLMQILTHTPLYVWLILAVLIYRGIVASRTREVAVRQLFIIPVVMLALSLQDIGGKFGFAWIPLSSWACGAALVTLLFWKYGVPGIAPGTAPGTVRVLGSRVPLAMMMAIFFTKYALAVTLAMAPQLSQDLRFSVAVCTLLGLFSGYFLGGLACNLKSLPARRPMVELST